MTWQYSWDPQKAARNIAKHGISFQEAQTVFDDPLAVIFDDEAHSLQEQREIIIGHSERGRLVLVCFVERGDTIRIISARQATPKERYSYESGIYS